MAQVFFLQVFFLETASRGIRTNLPFAAAKFVA